MLSKKIDVSSMTDNEKQGYEMGVEVPYECVDCKITRFYAIDIPDWISKEPYWVPRAEINSITMNKLIERAINKRCYIEACSLIHNLIEAHLRQEIFNKIYDNFSSIGHENSFPEDFESEIKKYPEIMKKVNSINKSNKYLSNITVIAYTLNIINCQMYDKIKKFNNERNSQIHELLEKNNRIYPNIIPIIELGRKIQLELILNKSKKFISEDIKKIVPSSVEMSKDKFLNSN